MDEQILAEAIEQCKHEDSVAELDLFEVLSLVQLAIV